MDDVKRHRNAGNGRRLDLALWIFTAALVLLTLVVQFVGGPGSGMALPLVLVFPFALIHGLRHYGPVSMLFFLVTAYCISNFFENLSILTGFPFGNYYYTGSLKLIYVPWPIGVIYCGLGYLCWSVANIILDGADLNMDWRKGCKGRLNTFALPIMAGAVMTMWDVTTDHWASTVSKTWIWKDGGGLFGVPYSNYLGWWFVTWCFFQVFALYLAWKQTSQRVSHVVYRQRGAVQSVLIYGSLGLQFALFQLFGSRVGGTSIDATGNSWNNADMFESMATVATFTIVPIALLALFKLWRGDLNEV